MEHPINDLFKVSMKTLEEMIDVNTVVGDKKQIEGNISIIPVSKVKCLYVTGGLVKEETKNELSPFGGATGGQIGITPVAFLIINNGEVSILHLDESTHLAEKIIDVGRKAVDGLSEILKNNSKNNQEND